MIDKHLIDKDSHMACSLRNDKARQYRRLYIACFIIFLVITALDRMLPAQWRFRSANTTAGRSVIEDAREQAGMFVPYLFMNF
ncbi:MAG: hypothetical protein OXD01_13885 [Gammaproteobacteria bacterium]|nr:hypothetical protein [Gammaproteobacteria bacterium]